MQESSWSNCQTTIPLPLALRNRLAFPCLLSVFNPHCLHIRELSDTYRTEFTPMPRPLHAPKRDSRVRGHHAVDEHHPRIQSIDEFLAFGSVISPGAGSQAKPAVVRDADRVIHILGAKHAGHWPKHFLFVRWRINRNIREHRGRIEVSRTIQ